MKNNILNTALVVIVLLVSLKLFDAKFIDKKLIAYINLLTISIIIVYSSYYILRCKGILVLPVQLIYFSIIFSMVMAYYSWGQSFKHSLIETLDYLWWAMFFILIVMNISIKKIENIVIVFGIVYIVLYLYQYINSGTIIFGKPISGEEFGEQRGAVRIIFPGAGVFILTIFIAITKLKTKLTLSYKTFYYCLACLGLIIPVMQVTRQFIIGVILVYFYHFMKGKSYFYKLVVIVLFMGGITIALNSDIPMVKGLIETQERDAKLGKKYIRVLAGEYFLTEFSPNVASQILGNGAPNWGISSYGKFIDRLSYEKEYFLSDVGIIAVYSMFGVFPIIGFILLWYRGLNAEIPQKYIYVKYYLFYLLFTSFTWFSVYHYHYLLSTVFAIYILHKSYHDNIIAHKILEYLKLNQLKVSKK